MKNKIILLIISLGLTVGVGSKYSYADWDDGHHAGHHGTHQYYHYHDHPHWGVHVATFYPDEYYSLSVGGSRYYYDDGVYYSYAGGNYVVAAPPIGAVVSTVPSDFQSVVINGITYYTDNGIYYQYTPNGYEVVSTPMAQAAPITVNVPSIRGGFISVTLRKSGNGFVGPQGEFYAVFPRVSQLQAMYGR